MLKMIVTLLYSTGLLNNMNARRIPVHVKKMKFQQCFSNEHVYEFTYMYNVITVSIWTIAIFTSLAVYRDEHRRA